ncbi:MAG TPA: alpha-2-macroglobulin family protein, partial [Polyangiaceae bacterium]|nr:alpha-2-macroglobulin family protein [Polyangiaceae bacterium]
SASRSLYVLGDSKSPLSLFRDSDSTELELITDKTTYGVGQKAKILVKSPWQSAEALVTVERSGVYEKRRVKLVGRAPTIEIPITEDLRPNAFVSVLMLKPRTAKAPAEGKADVGAPAYRLGFANLVVDPEERRLAVAVTPKKLDYRPGEDVSVSLDVRDAKGRPTSAELTVYAVDEGVLSLVDYKTPDPIKVFGEPRSLHVATLESRSAMASVFDPLSGIGLDKGLAGGGGGESSSTTRKDFRAAAYWNPSVVTNQDGKADVSFKLPDSLTTYRIMAVAASTDDRFGKGDARITSSRPLMARPALPRFLRAGDTFDASVVVTSKGATKGDIDVTAKMTGVTMSGEATKRVTVGPGESLEVRFPASAQRVGPASFRFDVKGAGESDSVSVERKVAPPMALEAVALYGQTSEAAAEKLGNLSAIRDDVGELTLTTSSTALVGLDGGADQLLEYPYGCTEQLTSRLVPLVALRDLAKEFGIPLPANADAIADKTVAKLLSHQRGDGGFGFWEDSPEPNAWATAYALWGLSEAKKHGVAVPKQAIEDGVRFLRANLEKADEPFFLGVGPLAVDVLAELGSPDPGYVSRLFERRSDMPLYSRGLLLHALVATKSAPDMIKTLETEIEATIRLDGPVARTAEAVGTRWALYLDSEVRTNALVLRGLVAARPGHPLAAPL